MQSGENILQNWKITIGNQNPIYPFVVVDNWYTPNEEKNVWKELDFFSATPIDQIDRAENTIVARNKDGSSKSKAYRFYVEDYYKKREISPILNCLYKQRSKEFKDILFEHCKPHSRSFGSSNGDSTLISYYEENDHYTPHHDTFLWTCLIWMVREPRQFDGGDFRLNEPNVEIKLRNNRMVMFPCYYLHEVTPLKFHTQPKDIGYGRYTITHFYYSTPNGNA